MRNGMPSSLVPSFALACLLLLSSKCVGGEVPQADLVLVDKSELRLYLYRQNRAVTEFPVWTNGCIALSNDHMEMVWQAVAAGMPIEIRP